MSTKKPPNQPKKGKVKKPSSNGKRKPVWLVLSRAKTKQHRILVLKDIFEQLNLGTSQYQLINPKNLWQILERNGIIPHPLIVKEYLRQETCIFCAGHVVVIQGVTKKRWEQRCSQCGYLYGEDGKPKN